MPLYEYFCEHCEQTFTTLRSMADYRQPAVCPACGASAGRILASAPRLNTMHGDQRRAHQVNERSAHAPRVNHRHTCGSGCNHQHGNSAAAAKPPVKHQPGKRPWMLGH